ncbi:unnamed protein product [Clonostachys byssicola]|uniref:Peptidase S33 tripeptidyl aminopeptidase-like C-terminal domain-containing protein n=1 Tax=Clonostachys byssicola TaxID=160290 RepID=A0A9N9U6S7_9HYPO|nr:unnamed protein product [Clonostachys byssicola]
MRSFTSQLLGVPLLMWTATASPLHTARDNTGINWTPCDFPNATLPVQCANLTVPLDYSNSSSSETMTLPVFRVQAAVDEASKKGSILYNCGGPGSDCLNDLVALGNVLQAATGGYHDIVTFTPRGTGKTLPFECFADNLSRAVGMPAQVGNATDVVVGETWAKSTLYGSTCAAVQNMTGNLIGTAFVARDMMQIVDALKEDGLLRYWGVSYGTLLGSTVLAMFPDRVDKIILDGVVNPFQYYANLETETLVDADATFEGFCKGCVENPDACPLAKNQTAEQLQESIYTFLEQLRQSPIPVPAPGGGIVLDYSTVKGSYLYVQLKFPSSWTKVAKNLDALMTGNLSAAEGIGAGGSKEISPSSPDALYGIKCGDTFTENQTFEDVLPVLETRINGNRIAGEISAPSICANWKLHAKERYSGDFRVKPLNPALIIGNTYDPVTPLVSARNVSETFEGSVLLQHDSYGHTSIMQASLCTAKAIRAYFVRGELPQPGTKCEIDTFPFSGTMGWDELIPRLAAEPVQPKQ